MTPWFCRERTALFIVESEYLAKYGCFLIAVIVLQELEETNEIIALSISDK
jgi:hypothetical protein